VKDAGPVPEAVVVGPTGVAVAEPRTPLGAPVFDGEVPLLGAEPIPVPTPVPVGMMPKPVPVDVRLMLTVVIGATMTIEDGTLEFVDAVMVVVPTETELLDVAYGVQPGRVNVLLMFPEPP